MTGPRILVVGDLVTDVVVRPVGALAHGSDTPAAIRVTGGGAGANTAAWLASAGAAVSLVARIGDDSAGRERRAELVALGVDCAAVAVDPDAPTGTIVVLVTADGERTMLPDRGANRRLRPADVDAGLAAAPTHLHLSGYVLLDDATRPAGLHALAAARSAGLTVSVDAASAAPLAATGPAAFLGWIDGIDLLLANADEATVLTEVTDAAAAAGKLVGTAGIVVVKRGADGSVWCSADTRASAGATATELVDSTGAGDAFAAGLLAAWLDGAEPAVALRAGGASGARAASVVGARP